MTECQCTSDHRSVLNPYGLSDSLDTLRYTHIVTTIITSKISVKIEKEDDNLTGLCIENSSIIIINQIYPRLARVL